MTAPETLLMAAEGLYPEAHYLDERGWDDWPEIGKAAGRGRG